MVTFVGQWWTDVRKPSIEDVSSHIAALAWMGLRHLPKRPKAARATSKNQRAHSWDFGPRKKVTGVATYSSSQAHVPTPGAPYRLIKHDHSLALHGNAVLNGPDWEGRDMKRKLAPIAGALVLVLIVAGAAYAYWTANGTGSGDASAGTDDGVTVDGVAFSGGPASDGTLYPGATVDVAFDVTNDSPNSAVNVHRVVADSTYGGGTGITTSDVGCDSTWFSYSGSELAASPGEHIAASDTFSTGAGAGTGNGGTLSMTDESGTNQDACKGATVTLHLVVDNSGI